MKYGSYLVCKNHVSEVKHFLEQFLDLKVDGYSHEDWITFRIPCTDFLINLMRGDDQAITQNFTIEIYFDSHEELASFADKHKLQIKSFQVTKSQVKYVYHYVEIMGPGDICKIEANYTQDLE